MRKHTYKAWHPLDKCWFNLQKKNISLKPHPIEEGRWHVEEDKGHYSVTHNLIFCKRTGLYDDNGKEIVEGDIVYAYKKGTPLDGYYTIIWDTKRGRWAYKSGNHIEKYQVGKAGNMHCFIQGNIFEHTEYQYT